MQSLSPQETACPHWLPGVLVGLCAAQPMLDVLSFWTQDLTWGSKLTLSLRLLIFLGVMLTGFVLSERRRFYWIAAAVCAALYAGHVLACLRANAPFTTANLISDATNFIRFAQLPLFTIAFITFLRCCRQGFASLERGITIAFWIIAAVALLSALTGTNPYTYPDKRIGLCGWFYFANSQSAILSMLVPLALCPALRSGQIRRWLVHGGDDGRTAAHRGLEQEGAAVLLGQCQQLCAVGGHHLLVGGAHAAAALEAGLDIGVCKAGAADGLHHHPDLRVFQNGIEVLDEEVCCRMSGEILGVKDVLDLHRLTGPAGNTGGIAAQHLVHAAAHRAKA